MKPKFWQLHFVIYKEVQSVLAIKKSFTLSLQGRNYGILFGQV